MTPDWSDKTVAVLGEVGPDAPYFATANEYVLAWESIGANVVTYRESDPNAWLHLQNRVESSDRPDLIQWTSAHGWRSRADKGMMRALLRSCHANSVPTIGVHLDRFWGIRDRERWILDGTDPYFGVDILFTADGGNQEMWELAELEHHYLPPGIAERWCQPGTPTDTDVEVAFVGSWRRYHREATHRAELIGRLTRSKFKVGFYPPKNSPAIRGTDLTDLYWSIPVAVGDSFFVARNRLDPPPHYSSDRIPESLGRGAILLHPLVEGVTDDDGIYSGAPNLFTWKAWEWGALDRAIEELLDMNKSTRTRRRNEGIRYMREHNTYEKRVIDIVEVLARREVVL